MPSSLPSHDPSLRIAVIGAGVSGLSAAWLLGTRHEVTIYEAADRLGGHANTVDAPSPKGGVTAVDTGFIVYNEVNYPNLTALFAHLGVATRHADMSLAVSLDDGKIEYGSHNLASLFAKPSNLVRPRFWAMLRDLNRFYRTAPGDLQTLDPVISLDEYLRERGYCAAVQEDHLLPMAAAIWSATVAGVREHPAAAFIRFFHNHDLLRFLGRRSWRTVVGGSRSYVARMAETFRGEIRTGCGVASVRRTADGVLVRDVHGETRVFDHVVFGAHAPQVLKMLEDPTPQEQAVLGAFRYTPNVAVLHGDRSLMPRRRLAWASWNHIGWRADPAAGSVTYWMNKLQSLHGARPLFLTLNPHKAPDPATVIRTEHYDHPHYDARSMAAQKQLWSLQGARRTWFCGAYFGSGFHEDGLQAGLAVAEQLGGVRRPWTVEDESGRIVITPAQPADAETVEAV
ncbi:NAD(P)/FAD-dependent oxidoreductase [Caulobacter sp. NIBR2454]|uniref:NAD(P)/FAD-dependent oxidoreductase n=1 Tax=Caulobacter sp. NIBR2454 TaxID=3015996 RepID=UPI0022B60551|nr:FAD-dependent oxidoreductase [Caulobacter sp. NIBR2454]